MRITTSGEAKEEAGIIGGTGFVRTRASVVYQVELRTPAPAPSTLGLLKGLIQLESFGLGYVFSKRIGNSRG